MLVTRAVLSARLGLPTHIARRRRWYSADAQHDDHHGELDSTEYPKEGLSSTFWGASIAVTLLAVGFWKFAPAPGEDAYLTRWIAMYGTPVQEWTRINIHNVLLAQEASEGLKLVTDARLPPMYRYRFPQRFDNFSAYNVPVGGAVDVSDIVVKGPKEQL